MFKMCVGQREARKGDGGRREGGVQKPDSGEEGGREEVAEKVVTE